MGSLLRSGEVLAANALGCCLTLCGIAHEIYPSRLSTERDFNRKAEDVCYVFLGSALANRSLATLRHLKQWKSQQKFWFQRWDEPHDFMRGEIWNFQPSAGEDPVYRWVVGEDHDTERALVSVFHSPSEQPNQAIVMLAGLSTLGTEAAAR